MENKSTKKGKLEVCAEYQRILVMANEISDLFLVDEDESARRMKTMTEKHGFEFNSALNCIATIRLFQDLHEAKLPGIVKNAMTEGFLKILNNPSFLLEIASRDEPKDERNVIVFNEGKMIPVTIDEAINLIQKARNKFEDE